MTHLNLARNSIYGEVPEDLSSSTTLKYLDLRENNLEVHFNDKSSSSSSRGSEQAQLLHFSAEDTRIEESENRVPGETLLRGLDVLDQSIYTFRDPWLRSAVSRTLDAIRVEDGMLHLNEGGLPSPVDASILSDIVSGVNQELINTGERIVSVYELERMLVTHGLRVVHQLNKGNSVGKSHLEDTRPIVPVENRPSAQSAQNSNEVPELPVPVVACDPFNVQDPHEGHIERGMIKTKVKGECWWVSGPKNYHYELEVTLAKRLMFLSFVPMWVPVDTRMYNEHSPNANWEPDFTDAKVPCGYVHPYEYLIPFTGSSNCYIGIASVKVWWEGRESVPRPVGGLSNIRYVTCKNS